MSVKSIRARDERDQLIISQLWKANQIARKVSAFTGLPYSELKDAATEYIVKIYDTYDPSKGANFSTWVNRCLIYHMLNYLRDHSRLVKIPRKYTEIHLRMKKLLDKNPELTDNQISEKLKVSNETIQNVKNAFSMGFTQINDEILGEETSYSHEELDTFFMNKKELLFRISELNEEDEKFLVDALIKKRSLSTLIRKNPDIKNQEDVNEKIDNLKKFIVNGVKIPEKKIKKRRGKNNSRSNLQQNEVFQSLERVS